MGERDRRLAACLPARLADWGRRESETRTPAAAAQGRLGCSLPRAGIRRTDGGRTMHYLRLRIRRGGTGEKGQRGELIPVMRTQNECLPTYLRIGLPRRRREVIFAREGEVVKGFGFIARRGTVYVPVRSEQSSFLQHFNFLTTGGSTIDPTASLHCFARGRWRTRVCSSGSIG